MLENVWNKIYNVFNSVFNSEEAINKLIENLMKYGSKVFIAIFLWYFGSFILQRVSFVLFRTLEKSRIESTVFKFLRSLVGVIIKILLFLIILSYFGVPTTSIIAVFGSVGLAIGFAAQGILANFVSGFVVLNSNFFKSSDYIKCGDAEGRVKDIEIFFTTLVTADGKLVKIPNNQFANTTVINFSANEERKVVVNFPIPYNADIALVKEKVKELIYAHKKIIKVSEVAVNVKEYTPYYIVLEARCYTHPDYFWDVQYFISDNLKNVLVKLGVDLPVFQIEISKKA